MQFTAPVGAGNCTGGVEAVAVGRPCTTQKQDLPARERAGRSPTALLGRFVRHQ